MQGGAAAQPRCYGPAVMQGSRTTIPPALNKRRIARERDPDSMENSGEFERQD
jgi:hypothetical protein